MKKLLFILTLIFSVTFYWSCKKEEEHVHNYVASITNPTCTERGFTTYICECGSSYKYDYVDKLGHSFSEGKCTLCNEADPNYVPEDLGGEVIGLKALDIALDSANQTVVFNYVLDKDSKEVAKDFNNITKIGYKAIVGENEYTKEIEFEKIVNVYSYSFLIDNEFENNYSDKIAISLYYKFINNKGNEKIRFSNEKFEFSFYELAKNTIGEFSESILSICEPDNIVRLDVTYNDEESVIATSTLGCTAQIVSVEGKDVNIKISSDEKLFSDNLRMYFNGKLATDFVNNGSFIEYKTRTETITEVNIELDVKEYVVLNNNSELYNLYVLDETGSSDIKVIIDLKNNNILSPFASVLLNGEAVEVSEHEAGSYVVSVSDERITSIELEFDIDTFALKNSNDKFDVVINRDANYDDIEVRINAKEGYEFSKRAKIVINKKVYLLNEVEFNDKEIFVVVEDNRVTKLNIELDSKNYAVLTEENDLYRFYVLEELGSKEIKIVIVLKVNDIFAKYVKVFVNDTEVELNEYENGNYIVSITDERITSFDFEFDLNTLDFENNSEMYYVTVDKDTNNGNIVVKVTAKEGYEFSKRMTINVNDMNYNLSDVLLSDTELVITIDRNYVTKVYITLEVLNLDPSDYNAYSNSEDYTAVLVPDKPNYEYIYVTITLKEGLTFGNEVKLYVNNKEVSSKTFKIIDNVLKYTQDDPNWTDIF